MGLHRDIQNMPEHLNHAPLGDYTGGRVWIEDDDGDSTAWLADKKGGFQSSSYANANMQKHATAMFMLVSMHKTVKVCEKLSSRKSFLKEVRNSTVARETKSKQKEFYFSHSKKVVTCRYHQTTRTHPNPKTWSNPPKIQSIENIRLLFGQILKTTVRLTP